MTKAQVDQILKVYDETPTDLQRKILIRFVELAALADDMSEAMEDLVNNVHDSGWHGVEFETARDLIDKWKKLRKQPT